MNKFYMRNIRWIGMCGILVFCAGNVLADDMTDNPPPAANEKTYRHTYGFNLNLPDDFQVYKKGSSVTMESIDHYVSRKSLETQAMIENLKKEFDEKLAATQNKFDQQMAELSAAYEKRIAALERDRGEITVKTPTETVS